METEFHLMGIFWVIFFIALYFLPWMEAMRRWHSKTTAIGVLNVLLGWTFIGWVIALVWACTENKEKA
jgi:succinate-acetate transporter protein